MKNGLLVWNIVLTLVAGYLLIVHFSTKKVTVNQSLIEGNDSLKSNQAFKIAYFEMDSVASSFDLVKEVKADLSNKEQSISAEMERLGKNLQQKYNYYQNQAQAGKLTQEQSEVASQEMKTLDDQMKNRKDQLDREYNDFMVRKQNDIKTRIEGFLKEYNKTRNYSYIVSYEQGLFYYRDTAYNITADVVKGLNEYYKSKKN